MVKEGFLRYRLFADFKELEAFTTIKQSLPLVNPRFTGDLQEIYSESRRLLANKLNIETDCLIFPRQEHTNCVAKIEKQHNSEIKATDALITAKKGLCLCVQTADCVPILLFEPERKVIAAVHAGWRGTVKQIVRNVVEQMVADYGAGRSKILAAIGPSIGPGVYEVGHEVVEQVYASIPNAQEVLIHQPSGKYNLNLWEANKQLLLESGVLFSNVEMAGECTYSLSNRYFSARRDGVATGRMVSGIMLK